MKEGENRFIFRKVATVSISNPGYDDELTLKKARFHIGDYIDISIRSSYSK